MPNCFTVLRPENERKSVINEYLFQNSVQKAVESPIFRVGVPEKPPELRYLLPSFLHSVMITLISLSGVLSERDFPSETTDFLFARSMHALATEYFFASVAN